MCTLILSNTHYMHPPTPIELKPVRTGLVCLENSEQYKLHALVLCLTNHPVSCVYMYDATSLPLL